MAKSTYSFAEIEAKWQKYWEKDKPFEVTEGSNKPKFYELDQSGRC